MKKTIELGNVKVEPGQKVRGKLFVGEFANGTEVYIPFSVINGVDDGKTLWINSGIHGNEVNGIVANQRLAAELEPEDVHGVLIQTLMCNPLAFKDKQRETKLDGGNLCEIFPGKSEGTITEKMAYVMYNEIKKQMPDALIDYHCWGMWHDARPYAVYKICGDAKVNKVTEEMVHAFGAHLMCKLDLNGPLDEPSPLGGALDVQCAAIGIPSFMAECGHSCWFEEEYIGFEMKGTKNVLRYLGIIDGEVEKAEGGVTVTRREILRCKRDGIAQVQVAPQQLVKKGERLAAIVNAYGDVVDEIIAKEDLYPISLRYEPSVNPTDRIAFVGYVK